MTLSTYLDRLEERGLVTREPDPTDRRANLVTMTQRADELIPRIRSVGEAMHKEAEAGIPPEEWASFLATLKKLRHNLWERRQEASRTRSAA